MIPEVAVAFVADLLRTDPSSTDHLVGKWMWDTLGGESSDAAFDAVNELMRANARGSRAYELAQEIWWLLGGREVAA
ncbi:hypothetical protein [Nocardia farcinica]|uniref:hypothetical protein n=1 Tax=Nocardia farcinica TaxID=37329 RepID=UPI001E4D2DCD|nr:hypothetical protein [Nocardia farcinica]